MQAQDPRCRCRISARIYSKIPPMNCLPQVSYNQKTITAKENLFCSVRPTRIADYPSPPEVSSTGQNSALSDRRREANLTSVGLMDALDRFIPPERPKRYWIKGSVLQLLNVPFRGVE